MEVYFPYIEEPTKDTSLWDQSPSSNEEFGITPHKHVDNVKSNNSSGSTTCGKSTSEGSCGISLDLDQNTCYNIVQDNIFRILDSDEQKEDQTEKNELINEWNNFLDAKSKNKQRNFLSKNSKPYESQADIGKDFFQQPQTTTRVVPEPLLLYIELQRTKCPDPQCKNKICSPRHLYDSHQIFITPYSQVITNIEKKTKEAQDLGLNTEETLKYVGDFIKFDIQILSKHIEQYIKNSKPYESQTDIGKDFFQEPQTTTRVVPEPLLLYIELQRIKCPDPQCKNKICSPRHLCHSHKILITPYYQVITNIEKKTKEAQDLGLNSEETLRHVGDFLNFDIHILSKHIEQYIEL